MAWTLKLKSITTGEIQDITWNPTVNMVTDFGYKFFPGWVEVSGTIWRVVAIDDVAADPVVNRRDFKNRPCWVDGAGLADGRLIADGQADAGGGGISP